MTSSVRSGPLTGVRVVEFDAIGPVPFAAMMLADMGCDVVRIERPGRQTGVSGGGPILGRGRRRVAIDLKTLEGREQALGLVARADLLLEGARPGVMERLGLGPDVCLASNPQLVYGRMTGWGQTGPLSNTAGHDINYIALTGALHAIGGADRPVAPLNLVGDYAGGALSLALGVTAALWSARETGVGQVVDAAMTDGSALLMSLFYAMLGDGTWNDAREANLLDGAAPFYRTYRCKEGGHVAVGAIEPAFFQELLRGLGLNPGEIDQYDREQWTTLTHRLASCFATRSRNEWTKIFDGTDACVTPVLSLSEAPLQPHNVARATFAHPAGPVQPMPAPRFSVTPAQVAPSHDIDFDQLLAAWREHDD